MSNANLLRMTYGVEPRSVAGERVRTLVLGLGDTAQSVARWLSRQGETALFVDARPDADTQAIHAALPDACVMHGFENVDISAFDQIIASPGIPDNTPLLETARAAGVPVLSDIALFCREAVAPIVCVTGTNGKSTVVSLLREMCRHAGVDAAAGGNLAPPALDLPMLDSDGVYLLELSSFQLQRTDNLVAHCACMLNISPDHLDWHGTFAHYKQAKERIYRHTAYAVVNADEALPEHIDPDAQVLRFTLGVPKHALEFGRIEHDGQLWFAFGATPLMPAADSGLRGEHNHSNVLAALALGSSFDLPMTAMLAAIREFAGLTHRHQVVATHNEVVWINDSKATNCAASLASIGAVQTPVIVLLGGRGKGEDIAAFANSLPAHVRHCVAYGENAQTFADALGAANIAFNTAEHLDDAVACAQRLASAGDTVLLAPAAASHDQYANYAARGEHFVALVEAISS